jgi:hypothetical protein
VDPVREGSPRHVPKAVAQGRRTRVTLESPAVLAEGSNASRRRKRPPARPKVPPGQPQGTRSRGRPGERERPLDSSSPPGPSGLQAPHAVTHESSGWPRGPLVAQPTQGRPRPLPADPRPPGAPPPPSGGPQPPPLRSPVPRWVNRAPRGVGCALVSPHATPPDDPAAQTRVDEEVLPPCP